MISKGGLMNQYLLLLIIHGECSISSECDASTKQKAKVAFWQKIILPYKLYIFTLCVVQNDMLKS